MDQHHALAWTRLVTSVPSRRDVLRGFGGAGLGLGITRHQEAVEAKKRKKRRKRKAKKLPPPVLNPYGCLDVGQPCRGADALCCSGLCEGTKPKPGKKDTSRCVGHNVDVCQPGQRSVKCGGTDQDGAICTLPGGSGGQCETTTGNVGYCGGSSIICQFCAKDTDCLARCGADAACIACAGCAEGAACIGTHSLAC